MQRVPLLSGSSLVIVDAPDEAVVLSPPAPTEDPVADVGAAVRDALAFPLAGEALDAIVPHGGRVAIVAEPPALPLPAVDADPRDAALAAASDEVARLGVPSERQTLVVAAGLARRPGRRDLERLVAGEFALRFRGSVEVHDAANPELVEIGTDGSIPLRIAPSLTKADAVVVVSAANTVMHGGPAVLLAACGAEAYRAATSDSLLETRGSRGWELALAVERALQRHTPVIGVSLTLSHPRVTGALLGYPYEPRAFERIARSPFARGFRLLPAPLRMRALRSFPSEIGATAVFAGPPSVAHTEALLRAIESGSAELEEPVDALCIGVPRVTPYLPRERPNALLASYLALGHALRLWRDAFPVRAGGTLVLAHNLRRRFAHPTQAPYRAFFRGDDESKAGTDERALAEYRAGRSVHPLQPYADWDACRPALERLGTVLAAGCRDATAARRLGFVPVHGIPAALEMVREMGGGDRIGFLLTPPYFPLRVGPQPSPR